MVARLAHNQKVAGSSPVPATNFPAGVAVFSDGLRKSQLNLRGIFCESIYILRRVGGGTPQSGQPHKTLDVVVAAARLGATIVDEQNDWRETEVVCL